MTDVSLRDLELARQMLACEARETGGAPTSFDAAESLIAGDRVLRKLNEHLSRWFGAEGFDALLTRALNRTQPKYPILGIVVRTPRGNGPVRGFIDQTVRGDDATALMDGLVALIAMMLALVSRLVGGSMVSHLVEQIWPDTLRAELHAELRVDHQGVTE